MAKKKTEPTKGEAVKQKDTPPDNAVQGKKSFFTAKKVETVVAVLLGVTTLLSAWASWIGSLHSGIQSINFTKSNNMASQGTSEYNIGMQLYLADYMAWNTMKDYSYELEAAQAANDQAQVDIITKKIENFKKQAVSEVLAEGIKWMEENKADNPFNMPGMNEKYFQTAQGNVDESRELLEEGMRDNTKGDSYNLVTVIFSLTLFLLGIVGTFKDMPNRIAVMIIAFAFLVFATIYMCTIPLPTGFEQMNFFEFNK